MFTAVGRINTLIYPVDGGMEDWLYAAGWDKAQLHHCAGIVDTNYYYAQALQLLSGSAPSSPSIDDSLGGEGGENPRRRASILDAPAAAAENRAVVFLVETSDRKKPLDTTLGGTENVS